MKKTIKLGKIKNNLWFDSECREKRAKARQALRKFIKNSTKTGANELRTIYTEERKKYKSLIKDKKSEHKKNVLISLEQNKHDPKTFWKTIKSATAKVLVQSSITQEEWFIAILAKYLTAIVMVLLTRKDQMRLKILF